MKKLNSHNPLETYIEENYPEQLEKEKAVICLGQSFASEDARREYYRELLRERLPELKKIEGYPIGEDEDIIALSDPPYYTACPNPWINDFVEEWEKEKLELEKQGRRKPDKEFNITEPYASDISEGKNNPVYNAHSYHTKVPHPAIMRYILHYTQPGDIVFDGFAGTGMTGVAAQICGNPDNETKDKIEKEWREQNLGKPKWGSRKAILGDLSPIASFIAYNYNTPVDINKFQAEVQKLLEETEKECGWMYQTICKEDADVAILTQQLHKCQNPEEIKNLISQNIKNFGKINYTVWSDVFICPTCGKELVFWKAAVDLENGKVKDEFNCYHCNILLTKKKLDKAWGTIFDKVLDETIKQTKTCPVMINTTYNKIRNEKEPDSFDFELIKKIDEFVIPYWFPKVRMPDGDESRRNDRTGITHVHHFYTKRNLSILSLCYSKISNYLTEPFHLLITSMMPKLNKLCRYTKKLPGPLAGTLYAPSMSMEYNFLWSFERKFMDILSSFENINNHINYNIVSNQSIVNSINFKKDFVDYIFTDPPFGANLMYSELNFLWESWLKVKTNNKTEAIENKTQNKGFLEYQELMYQSFIEYYRILKPNKWMTVEFSNTSAIIWNSIQTSLQRAGFIIANVAALDKQQGSFKAVTTATAVKQDLIISCYKPSEAFNDNFSLNNGEIGVWDFVREHLKHLPISILNEKKTTSVIERSPKVLFDRLISFYLMRNANIPIDAGDFQIGLKQRFSERDGLYFTDEQTHIYDDIKSRVPVQNYITEIITNEVEAIEWIRTKLKEKKQKYQDIMPDFRIATQSLQKGNILPELQNILEENFIKNDEGYWRSPDMHEIKDREILRNKVLLKEFNNYLVEINKPGTKKLKEVRLEALRAGFKNCWEKKEFTTIVIISEKIPQNILLEDEQLLMYYDIAKDKI